MASHAKDGGFQVFFVTSQVNESNDLGGFLADLCPLQAATVAVGLVHHVALAIKAQDVIAHTAGAAWLNLMLMAEELLPSKASAVVELTVCQDTQQGALSCIHIANHCYPEGERKKEPVKIWYLKQQTPNTTAPANSSFSQQF